MLKYLLGKGGGGGGGGGGAVVFICRMGTFLITVK